MRLQRIGLSVPIILLTAIVETLLSLNLAVPLGVPQALAQKPANRKAQTNGLVQQGIEQTPSSQLAQETRVSQCNQIIAVANEAVSNAKTITSNGNSSDMGTMLRAAEFMDEAAEKMKSVSLSDPILQRFQSRFILMYQQTSQATRDFVRAFRAQNRPEAESAIQALQAATTPEKQLVDEINKYCLRDGRNVEAD